MTRDSIFLGLLISFNSLTAQVHSEMAELSPYSMGTGEGNYVLAQGPEALAQNPGNMTLSNGLTGFVWAANPWGVKDLSLTGLSFSGMVKKTQMAVLVHSLHHPDYSNTAFYGGMKTILPGKIHCGLSIMTNYQQSVLKKSFNLESLSLGFTHHFGENWILGYTYTNLMNRDRLSRYLTAQSKIGIGIQSGSAATLFFNGRRAAARWRWTFGGVWTLKPQFKLMWGIPLHCQNFHFGFQIDCYQTEFTYAAIFHPLLGQVHSLGCRWIG